MASTEEDIHAKGLAGLQVIVEALKRHSGTGQTRRLARFLAGVYNGDRFPFDLTDLRALDTRLADACLAVLSLDRLGRREIHTWGIVDADQLNRWFQEAGLYYEAQQRRIGRELYKQKYGEEGHEDEGLTG